MTKITLFNSDLHNRVAAELTKGGSVESISRKCECSTDVVYSVKNSQKYAQLCYNSAMQELMTTGAKEAVKTLVEIARDNSASATSRVSASDKILHYTGCTIDENGNLEKSPSNMTQEELNNMLKSLQTEAASRAEVASTTIIEGEKAEESLTDILG